MLTTAPPALPTAPLVPAPASRAGQRPPVPALDPDSDRVLVIRAASGDGRAFAVIVRRYTALLRATAARTLGTGHADVDDVVQETFLAAWSHADSVIDGDTIAGWLVTTARRRSYDRLRSAAVRTRAELDEELPASPHDAPEALAGRASLAADARRVLAAMPPLQRRCWELRLDGVSYLDIGLALDLPLTTVRGMLARARATLAGELAHWR